MKKMKTYWWFWGLSIPFLIFGLFYGPDSVIDIPIHDTYFVVSVGHISVGIGLLFFIFGCGYIFKTNRFNPILNVLHFLFTILGFALILFPVPFVGLAGTPRKYYSNTDYAFLNHIKDMNNIISLGVYIIVLGLITYFINLGIAIFKNKT